MPWHEKQRTCVELRVGGISPPLTPRGVADLLGVEPSEWNLAGESIMYYRNPHPRQQAIKRPHRYTNCFFNSRIFTDSPDVTDHIHSILAHLEPRVSVLRTIAGQCEILDFKIRPRLFEPDEIGLDLDILLRLDGLGSSCMGFVFDCGPDELSADTEGPEADKFRFIYTLTRERGELRPYESPEYRFEYNGNDSILGLDGCSYGVEGGFHEKLVTNIHSRHRIIVPLINDGYRGQFRFAWDYEYNIRWDHLTRERLLKMRQVADRVVFAFE